MFSTYLETRKIILFSSKMMLMWIVLGAWMVIGGSTAQAGKTGQCTEYRTMDNFDPSRFAGVWYITAHTYEPLYGSGRKCSLFNFIKNGLSLTDLQYHALFEVSGASIDWEGKLTPVNKQSSGEFDLTFPSPSILKNGIVQILTTDYDHYAVQWGCEYGSEYYKILSRTPVLEPQYQKMVDDYINKSIASIESRIVRVDQQNCPKKN